MTTTDLEKLKEIADKLGLINEKFEKMMTEFSDSSNKLNVLPEDSILNK